MLDTSCESHDFRTPAQVPVVEPELPDLAQLLDLLTPTWQKRRVTNGGDIHERLETALSSRLGVECALTSSGTTAIELALAALDLPVGGGVVVPAFSFPATYQAVMRAGLRPIFSDVDPSLLTMTAESAMAVIDDETVALLPIHTFGCLVAAPALRDLAADLAMPVLFDAAAAFGAGAPHSLCGREGTASVFSFHATKVFTTVEGGAVVSEDERLVSRVKMLRNFGLRRDGAPLVGGMNGKLSELHAAVGLLNLATLEETISRRRRVAHRYRIGLQAVPGIDVVAPDASATTNASNLVIRVEPAVAGCTADDVQRRLAAAGIASRRYFSIEYLAPQLDLALVPVTAALASRTLCLPLYAGLPLSTVDRICEICAGVNR